MRSRSSSRAVGGLALLFLTVSVAAADAIARHPGNPHYFIWRGEPTILITSAEHYGAVLNSEFDYRTYLSTLAKDGLNYTRVFSGGAYVEPLGAFNIARNTLAPDGVKYLAPWARSSERGYVGGGNKFDLERWDPVYFERLKSFIGDAGRRGIVVEVSLFCPFYGEEQWALSPLNRRNNVNNTAEVARTNVYTLDRHGGLLSIEERLVKKLVEELGDFDNCFYEICNEPYFGGVTLEWQGRIAEVITAAQRGHPGKKLIAQNIVNGSARVSDPHPAVSILNFHYAAPPRAVEQNYGLGLVIGDDETGFRGTNDAPYRMEGWDFVVAGGGLYNNLDYSFVAGHEEGTFVTPASVPGGGNATFRRSMKALGTFIRGFDFVGMRPDNSVLRGSLPAGLSARALVEEGEQYAVYLRRGPLPGSRRPAGSGEERRRAFDEGVVTLGVLLPAGRYRAEWVNTRNGTVARSEDLRHEGGVCRLSAPAFTDDVALAIRRVKEP